MWCSRFVVVVAYVLLTAEPTVSTYEDMKFVFDGTGYSSLSSQITIPTFDAMSVCFWMQTTGSNLGTPFSYYDSVNDELAVYVFSHGGALGIYSCGTLITGVTGNDGNWNHVCLTWEDSGQVYFYWNGEQTAEKTGCMTNGNITGGGCFLIGQWQTSCTSNSFQATGSYSGSVAFFNIYSRVLNETEVATLAANCTENGNGDVLAWSDISNSTLTAVTVEDADVCPCNETTAPVDGTVEVTGTGISRGDQAVYDCDAGYDLVGADNATCTNTGWSYDVPQCSDTNECSSNNGGCNQTCVNIDGSYYCNCTDGYELDGDDVSCNDVDECSANNGGCGQTCVNTDGSFSCSCTAGYELDNDTVTCNDIDDCSDNNAGCYHTCVDVGGSFECGCDAGYVLDDDGLMCNLISGLDLTISDVNVTSPADLVYTAELDSFVTFYLVIDNIGDTALAANGAGESNYNISFYFSQLDDLDATGVNQTTESFPVDLNSATNLAMGVAGSSSLTITDVQVLVNVPVENCGNYNYACFLVALSSTLSDTESDTTNNDFCVPFTDGSVGQLTCSGSTLRLDWFLATVVASFLVLNAHRSFML